MKKNRKTGLNLRSAYDLSFYPEDGKGVEEEKYELVPNEYQGMAGGSAQGDSERRPEVLPKFRTRPHIQSLLGSAYQIAWEALARLEVKSRDEALDAKEILEYTKLVECVTRLAREEREQAKMDLPEKWTDEELEEFLRKEGIG